MEEAKKPRYHLWKRTLKGSTTYYYRIVGSGSWRPTGQRTVRKAHRWVCENVLPELEAALERHSVQKLPLKEFLEPYYVWDTCPHVARHRAERKQIGKPHVQDQRRLLDTYVLKDEIADRPVGELRRGDLLDFRTRLMAKANPRTVNAVMTTLRCCLKEGVFREELGKDPTQGIGNISYDKKEAGICSAKELADLFPKQGAGPWGDLQAHSGCRFFGW